MPDFINAAFEILGAFFVFLSIRKLYFDKLVRGIHWAGIAFFTSWGLWNIYYYPSLDQWASFAGAIAISFSNLIYLSMIIYYIRSENNGKPGGMADANLNVHAQDRGLGKTAKGILLDTPGDSAHTWRPLGTTATITA